MKEKVVNFLTNKWFHLVLSMILTFLIVLQEIVLSNPITVWYGLAFSAIFGLFYCFIYYIARKQFDWRKLIYWIIGGLIACIIALFI